MFAPHRHDNAVYISGEMVAQLQAIAVAYPRARLVYSAPAPVAAVPSSGAIQLNDVHQVAGTYDLSIEGDAPAGAPITLTTKGTFSSEVPTVTLRVVKLDADPNGHFVAVVPAAPAYFRGGIITVVASSVQGVTDASSQIVLKAPNANVSVPAEQEPKSTR